MFNYCAFPVYSLNVLSITTNTSIISLSSLSQLYIKSYKSGINLAMSRDKL